MNSFGFIHAALALLEAANPTAGKKPEQIKKAKRRFLFCYLLLMTTGILLIAWIIRSFYFG